MGHFQTKEGYSATNQFSCAVTNPEGQTQRYDVTVTAKSPPAAAHQHRQSHRRETRREESAGATLFTPLGWRLCRC
jgi:hypothetical protein